MFYLLIFVGTISLFAIPIGVIVLFSRTNKLRLDFQTLSSELTRLREERSDDKLPAKDPKKEVSQPALQDLSHAPAQPHDAPAPGPWQVTASNKTEAVGATTILKSLQVPGRTARKEALEEKFASSWLVWLGGVTLALGAAFLVKYSVEFGYLSPAVRCMVGAVMGFALVGGGEWVRRRPLEKPIGSVKPSYIPPALSAAGIVALFASTYAAYGIYDLLPAVLTFVLLAMIMGGAVILSFLQGPYIAALGLLGAFLVPALITSGEPSALLLFGYLIVLIAGSVAVFSYKNWWWLAWFALFGGVMWSLLWFARTWQPGDIYIIGAFDLALMAVFMMSRRAFWSPKKGFIPFREFFIVAPLADKVAWAAAALVAILLILLVKEDQYSTSSLIFFGAFCLFSGAVARRESNFVFILPFSVILTAFLMASWHSNLLVDFQIFMKGSAFVEIQVEAPELARFATIAFLFSALFGFGGLVSIWRTSRPAIWAAISSSTPIALLVITYWRYGVPDDRVMWLTASIVLAAVFLVVCRLVSSHREKEGMLGVLAVYSVAVVALTSLAATITFDKAWLTIALSLQLPALGWINERLRFKALRWVAMLLVGVVIVRLVLNPEILGYPLWGMPGLNWIIYGYGVPMVAFFFAARWFRQELDDHLVTVLEAGTLALGVLLVSFEIRDLVASDLSSVDFSLLERSLHSIAWLAIAFGLFRRARDYPRLVTEWGWRILGGLSTAYVLLLQVLFDNPMLTSVPVGDWFIANALVLAYAVPGVLFLLFAREAKHQDMKWLSVLGGIASLMLFFIFISMEVRHAFHGTVLTAGVTTDVEWYTYSVVWLVFAGIILTQGLVRGDMALRHASLAILGLVIFKVFLFDMRALEGLLRAMSFLGLGGCLVAVGYFYQRFAFPNALGSQVTNETGRD